MVVPELPDYLTSLGGEDYKGLIISLFTVTAGLSRPFSGKAADTIGRIPVMIIGAVASFLAALFYPLISGVVAFFLVRLFHGFSTGFKPTGTSAYVADIVPINRRGEAMGVLGIAASSGMALGPSLGSWVFLRYGIDVMFYTSSALALLSVLILINLKETLPEPKVWDRSLLSIRPKDFFEPRVLPPSLVFMLSAFSFGAILTLVPDQSKALGFENKGIFFTIQVLSSLAVRILAGKASDKYGRVIVIQIALFIVALSLILLGLAQSPYEFYTAAALFGIGIGMNSPTIYAWTIDLSDEKHRGRGLATMYIALEIGIGLGAFFSALIYDNRIEALKWAFWCCAFFVIIAELYLIYYKRSNRQKA